MNLAPVYIIQLRRFEAEKRNTIKHNIYLDIMDRGRNGGGDEGWREGFGYLGHHRQS